MSEAFARYVESPFGQEHVNAVGMRDAAREFVRVRVEGPSMTVQADKDLTDVNKIVARFKTARMPLPFAPWESVDVSSAVDYHQAMSVVAKASSSFEGLPSRVRRRFNNDPGEFLRFVEDKRNYDEAVELGLIAPDKARKRKAPPKEPAAPAREEEPKGRPEGAGPGDGGGATDRKA